MDPRPVFDKPKIQKKLEGKTAIITGGDSGIGRAVSVLFAKEGANVVIVYLNEHQDAEETKQYVEKEGVKCLLIAGDIGDEAFCNDVVMQASQAFPSIDILVNNAAEQHVQPSIEKNHKPPADQNLPNEHFLHVLLNEGCTASFKKGKLYH